MEQCDEQDDDCDGVVDDGVGGECGGCGDCASSCFGSAAGCSTWGRGRLDHSRSTDAGLTLDSPPTDDERVVWPGEDFPPVVFKVGALSHQIRGAYYTSHEADTLIESTRVNREGDLVVVNQVGSWITRIAAREVDCPDRNGNGVVDTSQGWEDLLAFDDERQWDDECILWETRLPERGKSVTLHETYGLDALVETAWVGIDDREGADLDSGFWELDARTGEPTGRVLSTPGFGPRRTASDDRGWIWAVAGTDVIAEFNPEHPELGLELHELDSPSLLSITVDEEGFPWVSSLGPARFDPATGELAEVYQDWQRDQGLVPTAAGFMAPDGRGAIWHVTPEFGDPFRADIATLQWDRFPVGSERGLSNVGVDLLGQLWVLGGGSPSGWVLDLEAENAEPTPVLDECRPRCMGSAANGEFTGLPWALLQPQRGVWTDDLVACDEAEEVQWTKVRASADVPRGSRITLFVRTGVDDQALWQGAWIRAGELVDGESDLPLDAALGRDTREHRFFAVQARLEADRDAVAPTLDSVQVLWGCQRPAE